MFGPRKLCEATCQKVKQTKKNIMMNQLRDPQMGIENIFLYKREKNCFSLIERNYVKKKNCMTNHTIQWNRRYK